MSGNLELILEDDTLNAYTEFSDTSVYDALAHLASYRGNNYKEWFVRTANEIGLHIGDRLTDPDERLVIDVPNKMIEYIAHSMPKEFNAARRRLESVYNFKAYRRGQFPVKPN